MAPKRIANVPADLRRLLVPVDAVRGLERNARRGDVDRIRESLRTFGQYVPIVARKQTTEVLKGNHTLQAAIAEGWTHVAVTWRDEPDDDVARRLAIADNRIGDLADWDIEQLAADLRGLAETTGGLAATGFTEADLTDVLKQAAAAAAAEAGRALGELADPPTGTPPKRPVTRPGDVVVLGDHVLVCGDSADPSVAARARDAAGDDLDLVFTSPPYNVDVRYTGQDDVRDFDVYLAGLAAVAKAWIAILQRGRFFAWNIGVTASTRPWRHAQMLEDAGLIFDRQMVWRKKGVPLPTWYHTRENPHVRRFSPNFTHELIYLFTTSAPRLGDFTDRVDELLTNDVFELHQSGATRDVPAGDTKTGSAAGSTLQTRAMKAHPAVFPVRLPAAFICHLTAPGELVADPYAGAGSVALACEQLDRRAVLAEIDPGYCDVAIERWETLTGQKAERPTRRRVGARRKETRR